MTKRSFVGIAVAISAATAWAGNVNITTAAADVSASSSAGRQGSTSGVMQDDPAAVTGTSGTLINSASTVAGPVLPGQLPTLPGTSGVAEAFGDARVNLNAGDIFATDIRSLVVFTNMDGGVYTATGRADFSIEFTVAVDTPYSATGSYMVAAGDLTWEYRLIGLGGFLINNATEATDSGPIQKTGTLLAGQAYELTGRVTASESLSDVGNAAEAGRITAIFTVGAGCGTGCEVAGGDADVDGDCDVDLSDLASVLANFGTTSGAAHGNGDTDFDGDVDLTDLANVLSVFGESCP